MNARRALLLSLTLLASTMPAARADEPQISVEVGGISAVHERAPGQRQSASGFELSSNAVLARWLYAEARYQVLDFGHDELWSWEEMGSGLVIGPERLQARVGLSIAEQDRGIHEQTMSLIGWRSELACQPLDGLRLALGLRSLESASEHYDDYSATATYTSDDGLLIALGWERKQWSGLYLDEREQHLDEFQFRVGVVIR